MIEQQPLVFAQPPQAGDYQRPCSASSIDELLAIKHAAQPHSLYPNHGFARGGVGHLISTGNARGSLNRLPQATRSFRNPLATRSLSAHGSPSNSRPTTVNTSTMGSKPAGTTASLPSSHVVTSAEAITYNEQQPGSPSHLHTTEFKAGTVGMGDQKVDSLARYHPPRSDPVSGHQPLHSSTCMHGTRPRSTVSTLEGCLQNTLPPPALRGACKAWEQEVPHPADFQSATRRTRIHDVPAASKWSSISFYETDPAEIRRHIDIVNALEEVHANGVLEDRQVEQMRHMTWAQRQRQIFLRQRQERALAYAHSGVPVRPAYLLAAQPNASAGEGQGEAEASDPVALASSQQAAELNGSRPCTTGSLRLYVPRWGSHPHGASGDGGVGGWGTQTRNSSLNSSRSSIRLPKPTYRKIFDRMGAETADSPRQAVLAWQQKQEAIKASKEALVIASQMHELDDFEGYYRQVQRQRGNALRGGKRYDTQPPLTS